MSSAAPEGLQHLPAGAEWEPDRIATGQGKIAGPAQKRVGGTGGGPGAVLHHMTMPYDVDVDVDVGKMLEVLRTGREKPSEGHQEFEEAGGPAAPADRAPPARPSWIG